jgi:hypothetical protein
MKRVLGFTLPQLIAQAIASLDSREPSNARKRARTVPLWHKRRIFSTLFLLCILPERNVQT